MRLYCDPIGLFYSAKLKKYELPRQPIASCGTRGRIELNPGNNFEQALEGLEEFARIWVLFSFHEAKGWKPKVLPTRHSKKVGVFATRSPHRPNGIGQSSLSLIKIEGRILYVEGADLLDKTPIIDIKPYLPASDSFPHAKAGWVEHLSDRAYTIIWKETALKQKEYLQSSSVTFSDEVFDSLKFFTGPNHYNRIKRLGDEFYVLAYTSWRFVFSVDILSRSITVLSLFSGYNSDLIGSAADEMIHRSFMRQFGDMSNFSCRESRHMLHSR